VAPRGIDWQIDIASPSVEIEEVVERVPGGLDHARMPQLVRLQHIQQMHDAVCNIAWLSETVWLSFVDDIEEIDSVAPFGESDRQ
jgi:hypothetical protein